MELLELLLVIYLSVSLAAVAMTWREQCTTRRRGLGFILLGYLACLGWPVIFPLVLLAAQRPEA